MHTFYEKGLISKVEAQLCNSGLARRGWEEGGGRRKGEREREGTSKAKAS